MEGEKLEASAGAVRGLGSEGQGSEGVGQQGRWVVRGWRSGKEHASFTRSSNVSAVGWALFQELDGEMGQ